MMVAQTSGGRAVADVERGTMHHRRRVAVSALAAGVLVVSCSAQETTTAPASSSGGLVLGLLVPESGSLSTIVASLSKPTELAVKQINDAGGVNGQPVKLEQADDGTDAQTTSSSFDNLVNSRGVKAIIGPASSGSVRSVLDKIKSRTMPTCSGSATAADLTKKDSGGYFFRTAPTDDLQGPALAEVITGDGRTKVGILARNDDYGTGFAQALEGGLKDSGASVVANVAYDPNGSNFDGDVGKVLDGQPDAVAVLGFNDDGGKIVSTFIAKGAGPDTKPLYTADGMQGSSFFKAVDPNDPAKIGGIKGTAPAGSPEGVDSPFKQDFPGLGVDPIFSAYYWDCTNLMALAAVKAKSTDAAKIKDAFASSLTGTTDCSDFKACKTALDAGQSIHYRGASNRFDKWAGQQPGTGAYEIWQYLPTGKVDVLKVPQIKIT
jgi:branched-chain amino acid transport system substrate-binding protein